MSVKKTTSGYIRFEWSDGTSNYQLDVRNVGDKHPEAHIQFALNEYDRHQGRAKPFTTFSIPSKLADAFIKAVKGED